MSLKGKKFNIKITENIQDILIGSLEQFRSVIQ